MKYVAILTILLAVTSCSIECHDLTADTYDNLRTPDQDLRVSLTKGSFDFFEGNTKLDSSKIAFLTKIGVPAYAQEIGFGIPVEVTLAQSVLESGWGTSELSESYHNYFGIKARKRQASVTMSTKEYVAGKRITKDAKFRKFDSPEEAIAERTQWFLNNWRYRKVNFDDYDYKSFCDLLQEKGYATDPHYSTKLQFIIERYNIDNYAIWLRNNLPKYE
jgi:flagellum-specific peptidoglycan hydrolase FlgJ